MISNILTTGDLWGIIFFLISLLCGIALVSVHYRKKYEEKKQEFEMFKWEMEVNN